eukprot:NODE_15192_length_1063_cov_5.247863.p5 GENE.NODE_15192_length_1063_cov_5.247863~~NODE_15192_length_1063_cov_5.247863.p5  ORF type:complete len:76 (-),score=23.67 NODE_15192_length_1063_cov_5.247863:559-786(-)
MGVPTSAAVVAAAAASGTTSRPSSMPSCRRDHASRGASLLGVVGREVAGGGGGNPPVALAPARLPAPPRQHRFVA